MGFFTANLAGQPAWLEAYMHWVIRQVQGIGPDWVGAAMILLDLLLALSLLTGVAVRFFAWVGIPYSLFICTAMGGMGGPYGAGTTDPGPGIVYVIGFVFVLLSRSWEGLSIVGRARSASAPPGPRSLALGRLLFGLLWAFDAFWKWHPYFITHVLSIIAAGQQGQPAWIAGYVQLFINIVNFIGPKFFGVLVASLETFIALGLLAGRWLRVVGPLGFFLAMSALSVVPSRPRRPGRMVV
jgi:hypothetical protein